MKVKKIGIHIKMISDNQRYFSLLTTDLLRTTGSFLQYIQHILSLPLTQWSWDSTAVWFHGYHRAILHTFVQAAASSRAIPHLSWGPGVTFVVCAD